jgi:SAM-dependent methyltransferase
MSKVQLYISAQSFLYRHPEVKRSVRNSYLYRTLVPLFFNLDRSFSDRRYLTETIFPALASSNLRRVLFVGCKAYTARYGRQLTRAGIDYWTTDIEPAAAIWGERDHHIVCDIANIDEVCPAGSFDVVLLNGVIGFGVDDESGINRTVTAIARILRPNGMLLIGWDSLKNSPDPNQLETVTTYFRHGCILPLPTRKTFSDTDKVYDWLIKNNSAEAGAFTQAVSDTLDKSNVEQRSSVLPLQPDD